MPIVPIIPISSATKEPQAGSSSPSGPADSSDNITITPSTVKAAEQAAKEEKRENGKEPEKGDEVAETDLINMETFEQLLDLDEDPYDFSRGMVWDYFTQAKTTFSQMKAALAANNLPELSSLGHFLKGSSAAIGIKKVQATCEKIQHYGLLRDEEADIDLKAPDALKKIKDSVSQVEAENTVAEAWLRKYFVDHGVEDDAEP